MSGNNLYELLRVADVQLQRAVTETLDLERDLVAAKAVAASRLVTEHATSGQPQQLASTYRSLARIVAPSSATSLICLSPDDCDVLGSSQAGKWVAFEGNLDSYITIAGQSSRAMQYRLVSAGLAIVPSISIVIPAWNEAANLPYVFRTLPEWVTEVVLVVDGRSTDGTVDVARQLRPDIKIVTQPGKGKGDALLAGFTACSSQIIVAMDGDGSADGGEIIRFVSALIAGADFATGSRFTGSGRSDDITPLARYEKRLLNVLANRMFGTQYSDLCYGYNGFWSRHLGALEAKCAGFEVDMLMSIRAAKAGLRIQEIPSHQRPRLYGASNLRFFRDGWQMFRAIFRERFNHYGQTHTD